MTKKSSGAICGDTDAVGKFINVDSFPGSL
jgi:hypothetical protein